MQSEFDELLSQAQTLQSEIASLQGENDALAEEIRKTIKRLQVPWSRIQNAPVEDCVVLSRRLIKLYNSIKDLPEADAIAGIQKQITYRNLNIVVGKTQTGEIPTDNENK
jgi:hypothetical protein